MSVLAFRTDPHIVYLALPAFPGLACMPFGGQLASATRLWPWLAVRLWPGWVMAPFFRECRQILRARQVSLEFCAELHLKKCGEYGFAALFDGLDWLPAVTLKVSERYVSKLESGAHRGG